jgi:replicative DNA helicase
MAEGRVPPYNLEAEIAVLGSVLLNNQRWGEAYSILESSDFYFESSRKIFDAMGALFSAGTTVDHVTLGHALKQRGDFQKAGGAIYLSKLTDGIVATANIAHYADIVRELSQIRGLIYEAQNVAAKGFESASVDDIYGDVEGLISAAQSLGARKMPGSLLSLGDRVLENYKLVADGYRGIELPWKTLDNMTAGLWPKTVTMFVARPSCGKSFICIISARHAWLSGKKVLIVSPEMSKEEMAERFFVINAGVNYQDVIDGDLPTPMVEKLGSVIDRDRDLPGLYIMDPDDDLSLRGIDAAIRAVGPDLVAVDSMYDLKVKGERQDRMIAALEWLKGNCKHHGYAAVGFAQQNRIAELSEKKGGGARLGTIALTDAIGQDAQIIFALEQTKDDKKDEILKVCPLKIRRGQFKRDKVRIHWNFEQMIFSEIEENEEEEYGGEIPF